MRRFLTGTLTLSLFFFLCTSFNTTGLVDDVLDYTNQFRKSKGLKALVINEELNKIAQQHSLNMAKGTVRFGHDGFNKRSRVAGREFSNMHAFAENVAFGAKTGKEAVTLWKGSSEHRANMLGKFTYIGIGVAEDRKGRLYYTQVFLD